MPETPDGSSRLPEPPVRAVEWQGDATSGVLAILDQTRLPGEERYGEHRDVDDVIDDIRRLAVRGAPAIGVAGAYGLVLAARRVLEDRSPDTKPDALRLALAAQAERLAAARPTAVNLRWAVESCLAQATSEPESWPGRILRAAHQVERYEAEASDAIARYAAERLRGLHRVLTHCNTGALVTPGLGTALAPLYVLHAEGERVHVWVDETRPLMQGLRLTAWELGRAGIPHAVLVEGAAAGLMRQGRVDAVIVGADRVAANGDVANKIGTYGVAVACHHHDVPFLVAAPLSTLDPATPDGDAIPIEERPGDLARYVRPEAVLAGVPTHEPAFDVTPAGLITCLVTERGTMERPDRSRLAPWVEAAASLQASERAGR